MSTTSSEIDIRYTIDESELTGDSHKYTGPIVLADSAHVKARCFLGDRPVSNTAIVMYAQVSPQEPVKFETKRPGLGLRTWLGDFDQISDFFPSPHSEVISETTVGSIGLSKKPRGELFGLSFDGHIFAPKTGLYRFALDSDDGSQLWIAGEKLIDNDGLHSAQRMEATIALERGTHPLAVIYFEKTGQEELIVEWAPPGEKFTKIPPDVLFH